MTEQIQSLLDALERELKQLELWSLVLPDEQALQSRLPFCIDTLRFEQWLQFIFIPKIQLLLDNASPLPTKIALLPLAEQVFKDTDTRFSHLLSIISALDSRLTEAP
ncbi:YqcC family protein [Rheinheimera fenheensis]|uniref:YqcC family protein n=1 Tax=Rheinheimera fenheensis TaxID=3152295 RepID=UPI0032606652